MSRSIVENGKHVWRYRAGQEDPQAFISLIHEVGVYKILDINKDGEIEEYTADEYFFDMNKKIADAYSDVITIRAKDIQGLKNLSNSLEDKVKKELDLFNERFENTDEYVSFEQLEKDISFMKENCPNVWFYKMVKSMVNYIDSNPKEEYHFVGEV